ncbi:uncharacterized protein LOC136025527 [Artemia franciscana]|uniref:Beta-lactamase-related domain-containing protein n=1 Tax=Artemia franciscana TaxID=6661 RepID=A0AA88HXS6_ARTSF|nr:hypothetical protein QYM36_011601 [Artemia franciscana]
MILIVFAFLLISAINCQNNLDSELDSVFVKHNMMGMSVATLCNGKISYVYNNGLKDFERNLVFDNNTMFRIASISKFVTTTGLMMLYDEGLFELNRDISLDIGFTVRNPHWPGVPITYQMLVSHTSGLRDGSKYDAFLADTVNSLGDPPSIKEILVPGGAYYTEDIWDSNLPGNYFTYCNLNFGVVGTLIEALSGERFDIYMRERLLQKMGIGGSYNVRDIEFIDDVAATYRNENGWVAQNDNYEGVPPEPLNMTGYVPGTNGAQFSPIGGLRISTLDLVKIMQLHLSKGVWEGIQLLSEQSVELMQEDVWQNNGLNGDTEGGLYQAWGLSVHHTTNTMGDVVFPDRRMFGHLGNAYGLISDFYFDPQSDYGVIFVTNGVFNGLSIGEETAFYQVEEDVFRAVFDNNSCP